MPEFNVGVVDYGVGNLKSVSNAFLAVGANPVVSSSATELDECSHLVLPGVGAFSQGMKALGDRKLDLFLREAVSKNIPLLGICLGMQLLMGTSTEFGEHKGLGFIDGEVKKIGCANGKVLRLPHVSWKPLHKIDSKNKKNGSAIFEGLPPGQEYYFIHSFCVDSGNINCDAYAKFDSEKVAAVVSKNKVIGTQFHPEKSGPGGLGLLSNFLRI